VAARSENAGAIFDLGYKGYTGARLGRPYAVSSLFVYSLRGCFGIGRKLSSKFFPFGIAALVTVPALLQVGVAAVVPTHITIVKPESYFGLVQIILALFCAAVAPELLTRDRRNNTLPLYFSRALQRNDYALSKAAALTTALFLIGEGGLSAHFGRLVSVGLPSPSATPWARTTSPGAIASPAQARLTSRAMSAPSAASSRKSPLPSVPEPSTSSSLPTTTPTPWRPRSTSRSFASPRRTRRWSF